MSLRSLSAYAFTALLPVVTYGATVATPRDFRGFVALLIDIIQTLVVVVFALTFLVLMWGIIRSFIMHGGDTEGIEDGKKIVLAGIIGLVVMSSIWGILYLFQRSLFG